jgi:hypothetical protein
MVKGGPQAGYLATLPAANDAFIIALVVSAGVEADNTLNNYDDFAALFGAANDEATFTNYARKSITSVTVTEDNTNNRTDVDIADQTWTSAGGGANNTLAKMLIGYDPDTTGGTDSTVVPLAHYDFSYTTTGVDLIASFNASGILRIAV